MDSWGPGGKGVQRITIAREARQWQLAKRDNSERKKGVCCWSAIFGGLEVTESSFGHVEVAEGTSQRPEVARNQTVDAVYKSVQPWTLLVLASSLGRYYS